MPNWLKLQDGAVPGCPGTNRDETSRYLFVLGQNNILVLLSFCPGTRAGAKIPGQTLLSRDKITITLSKIVKNCNFFLFFCYCPASQPRTERDRLSKSCFGPSRGNMSKSCPGPSCGKILSLSRCHFGPGQ
jgi:hypothetical protein